MQLSFLDWRGAVGAWLLLSAFLFAVGGLGFAAARRWRRSAWLSAPLVALLAFQVVTRFVPPSGGDFDPSLVRRLWVFYIAIHASGLASSMLPMLGARRNPPGPRSPDPPNSLSGTAGG